MFLLLSNLQSGSNIGSICRNALAFNVSEVVIVGRKDIKMRQADRGARLVLNITHFVSLAEAGAYLRDTHSCRVLGIEICDEATSIMQYAFDPSVNYAFVFGNEGDARAHIYIYTAT
jgi:tRNA G18 (ribose-2'-O)-methylase SpoU